MKARANVRALVLWLVFTAPALPAQPSAAKAPTPAAGVAAEPSVAQVEIDGVRLFRVRGVEAYPAQRRAAEIEERVAALARDPAIRADSIRTADTELGTEVRAGNERIMIVLDADAQVEGVSRSVLAAVLAKRIAGAIDDYRRARAPPAIYRGIGRGAVATAGFILLMGIVYVTTRRIRRVLEANYRERVKGVGIGTFEVVRADRIWKWLSGAYSTARTLVVLVAFFFYVQYVLGLFPWTRGAATKMFQYVVQPVQVMTRDFAAKIPDLIFLAILFLVVRYLLKVVRVFFGAIQREQLTFSGFDRDWAEPTYKLIRIAIVIFSMVVAYPYIPGAGTDAFKGISVFVGLVLSLGASSAMANIIAGYMMTYRRAFKVGDRVKIGDVVGNVIDARLHVTHLKTVKNEEVIVPNSSILNNEVLNYTTLAHTSGLILHTNVSIGYETPWRQVEAMLLLAARRTEALMTEHEPFVLLVGLGDFAVNYELNVYCSDPQAMAPLYSALHRNILDVFNEYGVQIMTPAYEGDPTEPKVVSKERWYTAPARLAQETAPFPGALR